MTLNIIIEDLKDQGNPFPRGPGWEYDFENKTIYLYNCKDEDIRLKMLKKATSAFMRELRRAPEGLPARCKNINSTKCQDKPWYDRCNGLNSDCKDYCPQNTWLQDYHKWLENTRIMRGPRE